MAPRSRMRNEEERIPHFGFVGYVLYEESYACFNYSFPETNKIF